MILLINVYKKNKHYYMSTVDTNCIGELTTRLVNAYNLGECSNIRVQRFISSKQNPVEYLRGDFAVSRLIVENSSFQEKANDFQVVTVYHQDDKPCLYLTVDRMGKFSLHDVSELDYAKNSIFGSRIDSLPSFVEHKSVTCAYEYLQMLDVEKIKDMPVGLFKQYLLYVKGFEEGYHTITKINNGVACSIHEHLLFKGSATIRLVEYIPENKKTYLTKQDFIANPYPLERTVGSFINSIDLVTSANLPLRILFKEGIAISSYDTKSLHISLPVSSYGLKKVESFCNSKQLYEGWHLDHKTNMPKETYANILPHEFFELPKRFYFNMRNKLFPNLFSSNLRKESEVIDMWFHTIAFYSCWTFYSHSFKKKLRFIMKGYSNMYTCALANLIQNLGPRDALYIMKWTEEHLAQTLKRVTGLTPSGDIITYDGAIDPSFFTFAQNSYDLPEILKVYSTETIDQYGLENLKNELSGLNTDKQRVIINRLEEIEKSIQKGNKIVSNEQKRFINKPLGEVGSENS